MASVWPTGISVAFGGQQLVDNTLLEAFNLDLAFFGADHGHDVAAFDRCARLDQPFEQRARFHVGAQARHNKLSH